MLSSRNNVRTKIGHYPWHVTFVAFRIGPMTLSGRQLYAFVSDIKSFLGPKLCAFGSDLLTGMPPSCYTSLHAFAPTTTAHQFPNFTDLLPPELRPSSSSAHLPCLSFVREPPLPLFLCLQYKIVTRGNPGWCTYSLGPGPNRACVHISRPSPEIE